jgi:hypothetical protein
MRIVHIGAALDAQRRKQGVSKPVQRAFDHGIIIP